MECLQLPWTNANVFMVIMFSSIASGSLKRCAHTNAECLAQVVPAKIYVVSQEVVDHQAQLLDSNAMALGCWTERHK